MTEAQKFQQFINDVDAMCKAQDKADSSNSFLFKEEARKLRMKVKVFIAGHRLVAATPVPLPAKKKKWNTYKFYAQ